MNSAVLVEIVELAAEEDTGMPSARVAMTNGSWKFITLLEVISSVYGSMTGLRRCLDSNTDVCISPVCR
jgi:hypothetical protein